MAPPLLDSSGNLIFNSQKIDNLSFIPKPPQGQLRTRLDRTKKSRDKPGVTLLKNVKNLKLKKKELIEMLGVDRHNIFYINKENINDFEVASQWPSMEAGGSSQ